MCRKRYKYNKFAWAKRYDHMPLEVDPVAKKTNLRCESRKVVLKLELGSK